MKVTKFSKSVNETLDSSKLYSLDEAFNMLMSFKRESFNESVDVAFNLGVDPRHAEENIRLSINLPSPDTEYLRSERLSVISICLRSFLK